MTLTLWHYADYGSLTIRILLEELGQPYQLRMMDWHAGDFDLPAYRSMNPPGRLPVLETPDGPIFDTAAIILWMSARYSGLGPAVSDPAYAAFLSWLLFAANTIEPTVWQMIGPDDDDLPYHSREVVQEAYDNLVKQASYLEALLTTQSPRWLTPAEPALGHYLGLLFRWNGYYGQDYFPFLDVAVFPALRAMLAAHQETPAARRVAAADKLGDNIYTWPDDPIEPSLEQPE